jgi:hypothetical protein
MTTQNFFEYNPLMKFPCPFHLLHISLMEFFLFEKMKSTLIGQKISDEIDILEIVTQILDGISSEELQTVFRS